MANYIDKSTGTSYKSFSDLERAVRARSTTTTTTSTKPSTTSTASTAAKSSTQSGSSSYSAAQIAAEKAQESKDYQAQLSSPNQARESAAATARTSPIPQGAALTPAQKSARITELIDGYRKGTITGTAATDELVNSLGFQLDSARSLLGITAVDPEGSSTKLETDVWNSVSGSFNLSADQRAQIDWIVRRHLSDKNFTEDKAYAEIAAALGNDPTKVGQPDYNPAPFMAIQKIFESAKNAASGTVGNGVGGNGGFVAATSPSDTNWLTKAFPGLNTTNMPNSELRPLDETAFGALKNQYNLPGMAPFLSKTLQSRAGAAVPQFRLGAALGQFGQYGFDNNRVELGGEGLQGLMGNAALKNLQSSPTSGSYQQMMNAAQQGLGQNNSQAAAIMAALGITDNDSASTAYQPIYSEFIQPRLNQLPVGIRDIFQAGAQEQMQQTLGGKSSAEINPAEFLQQLSNMGMFR